MRASAPVIMLIAVACLHVARAQAEDVLLSELLGEPALVVDDRDRDDHVAGRVEDVLLDREGRIISIIVNRNLVTNQKEADVVAPAARRSSVYEKLYEFDIADIRVDSASEKLETRGQGRRYPAALDVSSLPLGQVGATELLELPVNLVNERAGTVEDVLLDFADERAVGIVVDAGIAFTTERYLFPPDLKAYDREAASLDFALKKSELDQLSQPPKH